MLLAVAVSYILVHNAEHIRTGPDVSLDAALATRDRYGSDFLWFKKDGRQYLIRDAATLDRADHLFDRAVAVKLEGKSVKRELRPLERRERDLDREIDALTDRDNGPPLTEAEHDRLNALRGEMASLHSRMRVLEGQQEDFERRHDALEAEAERALMPMLDDAIRTGIATPVR